jgi:hypothetical protein
MRRTALALALAALLALPAAAPAKGIDSLAVCGPNGCHAVHRPAVRAAFEREMAVRTIRRAEPWLRLRARARVSSGDLAEVWTGEWLPRAGVLRVAGPDGAWVKPGPALRRALDRAARGLRTHRAATLAAVSGPSLPPARVVEVFSPAGEAASRPGRTGASAAAAAALAIACLGLGAAALAVRRRRRAAAA